MHVCIHTCAYVYIHEHVCMHIRVDIHLYEQIHVCMAVMYEFMCVYLHVCMCTYICAFKCVSVCTYRYMYMCIHVYMSVSVHGRLCVRTCLFTRTCTYTLLPPSLSGPGMLQRRLRMRKRQKAPDSSHTGAPAAGRRRRPSASATWTHSPWLPSPERRGGTHPKKPRRKAT